MKQKDFTKYSDDELRDLYKYIANASAHEPVSGEVFPEVSEYINHENPQGGNYATRQVRVMNLIKAEVFARFMSNVLDK